MDFVGFMFILCIFCVDYGVLVLCQTAFHLTFFSSNISNPIDSSFPQWSLHLNTHGCCLCSIHFTMAAFPVIVMYWTGVSSDLIWFLLRDMA